MKNENKAVNRRAFLKTTGAVVIGSSMINKLGFAGHPLQASSNTLKVGLIGCGGRGAGAASQALQADANIVLTAMGDVFQDRLDESYKELAEMYPEKVKVDKAHKFVGFDAYKKVIESDVDVVLLATPPAFRPDHMMAAIEAGKHAFCEKPVAIDAPGVRKVLAAAKKAKEMKRDQEKEFSGTNVAVAGSSTVARVTASFDSWLFTNDTNGTSGTQYTFSGGVPTTARTDGTDRAWSEALLKAALLLQYNAGGEVSMCMVSPAKKQETSSFAGIAEIRFEAKGAKPTTIIGSIDVYSSDFGNLDIVPNRFMPTDLAYLIDPSQVKKRTLRPYFVEELAKTGDSSKFHLIEESGLEVTNEAAHAVIRDLS